MIKSVIQEWKVRSEDFGILAGILAGIWVFGMILEYLFKSYTDVEKLVVMGSELTAFTLGIILLLGFGSDICMSYDWAVGFGKTREKFLASVFCVYFINGILLALETRLLLELELIINRMLYKGAETSRLDSVYISLPWIFAFVVLAIGLAGFGGMIVHKFRGKGGLALLMLWFGISFEIGGETSIVKAAAQDFLNLSVGVQLIATLLLGIAGMTSAALVMKKEAVKG